MTEGRRVVEMGLRRWLVSWRGDVRFAGGKRLALAWVVDEEEETGSISWGHCEILSLVDCDGDGFFSSEGEAALAVNVQKAVLAPSELVARERIMARSAVELRTHRMKQTALNGEMTTHYSPKPTAPTKRMAGEGRERMVKSEDYPKVFPGSDAMAR